MLILAVGLVLAIHKIKKLLNFSRSVESEISFFAIVDPVDV